MTPIPITRARKDLYKLAEETIKWNTPQMITTKQGVVMLVSGEDWRNMHEQLHLENIPGMMESIKKGIEEPIENCSDTLDW